ncbi:glycosyltransferase [Spiribacter roseus]|uniref:glycosyltransferase n=1 Tax=Spiribacter roseus TaxID=1855875 RepID=UPI0013308ADE|nr:glycosyltransferase [Spiribacter roseus]
MPETPEQEALIPAEESPPSRREPIRVFFICPLPQWVGEPRQFLAARTKIFLLIEILKNQGFEVVLINSGRQMGQVSPMHVTTIELPRGGEVSAVIGPSRVRNSFGRLLTLFSYRRMLALASERFGMPDIVWCYNAYAFEMLSMHYLKWRGPLVGVLEFEDHPLARMTGLKIKPMLDWISWRRTADQFDICYAVNQRLADQMTDRGVKTEPLPGLLAEENRRWFDDHPPSFEGTPDVVVAYSGGLDNLKGVDFLLEIIAVSIEKELPIEWHITGSGPLESDIKKFAGRNPSRVHFHGVVPADRLRKIRSQAHVLLNPHKPNGDVFPFKVIDAVSTGRLVISTPLQHGFQDLEWLDAAVCQVELNPDQWMDALLGAERLYNEKRSRIRCAMSEASENFSEKGFGAKLHRKLAPLVESTRNATVSQKIK